MRRPSGLTPQYRMILRAVGQILIIGAVIVLLPVIWLIASPEEVKYIPAFLIPVALLAAAGGIIRLLMKPDEKVSLGSHEGGVIVLLGWSAICLASALPFMIAMEMDFTQSIFESVSGWTTTGLSVIDVGESPRVILFFRSLMQFAGGAGWAIIMLSAIAGPIGAGFANAEGRSDQLVPNVRRSARLVLVIYSGYAIVGIIAYWIAGMSAFDAINHAFAAVSTGGFSTQADSIGHWNSIAIEAVSIPLMILGGLNFLTAYLLLKGKFRAVYRNGEVRTLAVLLPVSFLLIFLFAAWGVYPTLGKSVRVAIFESVTALTTTGFTTVSYNSWSPVAFLVVLTLMIIGGCTCSTAGGIKLYRVYLLTKTLFWDLRRPFMPRTHVAENAIWRGESKDYITNYRIRQVSTFVFLYLATYVIGVIIIAAHGYTLRESLFEFASALGTVGLSVGVTSADAPPLVLWTKSIGMLLGRLEFFVVFTALTKIALNVPVLLRRK